ncbi:hypothetical protein [Pseudomonas sp. B21-048]|uniref:hypothetical protein n=1 Tax=Pseudomonas sp. B21-048 TaxID=2895490 RepID=UPI00215E3DD1|nr:hypothetical protein [Pseudomonas sp. B21-048]UVL01043.1 hypothetical protein LOY56_12140 [Pseudomonas sp. B21-048]
MPDGQYLQYHYDHVQQGTETGVFARGGSPTHKAPHKVCPGADVEQEHGRGVERRKAAVEAQLMIEPLDQ